MSGPYEAAARAYQEAGWAGVLPLPEGRKTPPPAGYTGAGGRDPDPGQVAAWIGQNGRRNIALRMPPDVVGIDVDAYSPKRGGETLAAAEASWGRLPPTYRSSSRADDPVSGIRYYRVPAGTRLAGVVKVEGGRAVAADAGGEDEETSGVEIVQRHHRYAVVAPSVHPEGRVYQWWQPDGSLRPDGEDLPHPGDLPELPELWLRALVRVTGARTQRATGTNGKGPGLSSHRSGEILTPGEACPTVRRQLSEAVSRCVGGSRHDHVRDDVAHLVRLGEMGHPGVEGALRALGGSFVAAVGPDREGGSAEADAEFDRMIEGAVSLVSGDPTPAAERGCRCGTAGLHRLAGHAGPEPSEARVTRGPQPASDAGPDPPARDWRPRDLAGYLSGQLLEDAPSYLTCSDGSHLLYPRLAHWLFGEPESGKSWIAQALVAEALQAGKSALYVDFESDPGPVVARLRALGCSPAQLAERLHYIRPESPLTQEAEAALLESAGEALPAVAVVDGANVSMALLGYDPNSTRDTADWWRRLGQPIRRATAGPTLVVDHVTKDPDKRGRWAIGSQHKLAALDGAAFGVEVVEPFGRGRTGKLRLVLAKDRPGHISGRYGRGLVANVTLTSHDDGAVSCRIDPGPGKTEDGDDDWRPTELMERVSRYVEAATEPSSGYRLREDVKGSKEYIIRAASCLVEDGYLTASQGRRGATLYSLVRPYRQSEGGRPALPAPDLPSTCPEAGDRRPAPPARPPVGAGQVAVGLSADDGHLDLPRAEDALQPPRPDRRGRRGRPGEPHAADDYFADHGHPEPVRLPKSGGHPAAEG